MTLAVAVETISVGFTAVPADNTVVGAPESVIPWQPLKQELCSPSNSLHVPIPNPTMLPSQTRGCTRHPFSSLFSFHPVPTPPIQLGLLHG